MKKGNSARRIITAILTVCLLLTVLASCNNALLEDNILAAKAMTLTISMIKEEGTTEAGIKAVENAINNITEGKYNTHIVLQMFTADEYRSRVLEMSEKLYMSGAGSEGTSYVSNRVIIEDGAEVRVSSNGDYSIIDEKNRAVTIYPTITDTQLDIVLIDSIDTYYDLAEGVNHGYPEPFLASLTPLVPECDIPVEKYINSVALGMAKNVEKNFFAIPNNTYYGDYSYLFINKEYFDALGYDLDLVSDLSGLNNFIYDVASKDEYSTVTPLYNFTGFEGLSYFDFDSPLCLQASTSYQTSSATPLNDMLAMSYFQRSMETLYYLNQNCQDRMYNDSEEVDFTKDFAVATYTGDRIVLPQDQKLYSAEGKDYYLINTQRPAVDNKMFESMYAVSQFTTDKDRAFEILALLETDSDIVNLLAYGVNNTHYELSNGVVNFVDAVDEDGNDISYNVDYKYAGNNFLCLPNENMDEETMKYAADNWALAKKHNELVIKSPYCGYTTRSTTLADYVYYGEAGITFREMADKTGVELVDADGKIFYEKGKCKKFVFPDIAKKSFGEYCETFMPRVYDFDAMREWIENETENGGANPTVTGYLQSLAKEFEKNEVYCRVSNTNIEALDVNFYTDSASVAGQYSTFFSNTYLDS